MSHPHNITIGDDVYIDRDVAIGSEFGDSRLSVGVGCRINNGAQIDFSGGVDIGDGAVISQQAILYSHSHGDDPHARPEKRPKRIGRNVWIGARAIVLESCAEIGDDALVGAGAVVSKDLAAGSRCVGASMRLLDPRV